MWYFGIWDTQMLQTDLFRITVSLQHRGQEGQDPFQMMRVN